jgi:hypothetical protein
LSFLFFWPDYLRALAHDRAHHTLGEMLRDLVKFVPWAALLPLVRAEGTVQDLWNSPQYPDYTTNYTAGTTIEISWQHALAYQFQYFCESCDITNVDLWVTGSSYTRKLEGVFLLPRG